MYFISEGVVEVEVPPKKGALSWGSSFVVAVAAVDRT